MLLLPLVLVLLVLLSSFESAFSVNGPLATTAAEAVPCTAEESCFNTTQWRCVEAPEGVEGAACMLDYGYNTTRCVQKQADLVAVVRQFPHAPRGHAAACTCVNNAILELV